MMSIETKISSMTCLFAQLRGDRSGAAATEFALLFPLLALLLAGIIDFSRLISQRMQVQAAAQAGADYAIRHGWNGPAIAGTIARTSPNAIAADPAPRLVSACLSGTEIVETVTATCSSGLFTGKYVLATARASFTPLMPWPGLVVPDTIVGTALTRVQ